MPGGQHSQEFYSETWAEAGHQGPAPGTRPDVPQALGLGRRMGEAVREAPLTSPFLRAAMLGPFTPYGALKPGDSHLEGKKLGHKEAPAQGCWAAGGHRNHTQNVLARAERVVGPQETPVALIQLLLIGLFLISGSCKTRTFSVRPKHLFGFLTFC